ncbi:hypothetical protein HANVADRAFT_52603 [Hanseniaspora valbyensis NRRL Y-1626]|uniref:Protein CMS1 n=1 Tax=Hanseniaspora valbyensis NRRL Y-1626 TaxID=766949 RepID=A0A1B7TED2_9ASCO|nr:hypothetical protein HANVADRAFT_52603 [Hanseniaspora valbyensis NRRL Y-1626]
MSVDDLEDNLALDVSDNEKQEEQIISSENQITDNKRKLESEDGQEQKKISKKAKTNKNASNNLSTDSEFIKSFSVLPLEQVVQYFNVNLKKADSDASERPFLFSKNDFKDTSTFPISDRKLPNFNKFLTTFINQRDAKTKTIIVSATNIRVADIHRAIHLDLQEGDKTLKGIKLFNKNKLKQDIETLVNISKSKDDKYKNVKNYITTPTRLLTLLETLGQDKKHNSLWLKDKSKLDVVIDCQFMINSNKNVNILNDFQTVYKLLDLIKDLKQIKGNSLRIILY